MSQHEFPQDEGPVSGERHSRERIVRPSLIERLRRYLDVVGSPSARVDLARRLLAPLVLAFVPLFWVVDATHRATLTTIGRDQGIFHYIAWAVRHGAVDYRDIRDVNGPLVHLIHMVMLALGGADEHRFHVLDMLATGASFAIVGWLLPGIVARPRALERLAWAFATWVVLSAQYGLYLYWNQAQRESFCDWFFLPSLALQIASFRKEHEEKDEGRRIVLVAALSTITWFGKSSFVLLTVAQLACLLLDSDLRLGRKRRLARFALGGALGAVVPLVYLFRYGDVLAFLQVTLRDVPQVYRYIWAKSAQEILGEEGPLGAATLGLAVSALVAALVVLRTLPRRMLALAVAPLAALGSALAQHKGFGYHFHPLTATSHIGLLVITILLWEKFRSGSTKRPFERLAVIGAIGTYAFLLASAMKTSPHTKNVWILAGGETPEDRATQEYFDSFKTYDYFPWELRQGARYLADKLPENARVQTYGMDPYILFLAQRRSATPYIYAYDLNADAALDGGWSNRPTPPEKDAIRGWRWRHEHDMLARLKEAPPEAFVFVDRSPLITFQEAWEDFRYCCMDTATWVAAHYHPARSFDTVHVWFRDDLPIPDLETYP